MSLLIMMCVGVCLKAWCDEVCNKQQEGCRFLGCGCEVGRGKDNFVDEMGILGVCKIVMLKIIFEYPSK